MNKISIDQLADINYLEKIANLYNPDEIVEVLSFQNALRIAYRLLYNDKWDTSLQNYAISLLYTIRKKYPIDWNSSWEYDALLGLACNITERLEERYDAYKRAYDKAGLKPPELLIEFARCCVCPGRPPISYDDAINLIMQAIDRVPYVDGVGLLCNIYSLKGDKEKEDYWTKTLEDLNRQGGVYSPSIEPKFLVEEYLEDLKRKKME